MSTPDRKPDACKHPGIVTYAIADEGPDHGQPAGLWACRVCGHKFVPLDLEMEARAALSEPVPEFCCKHSWSAAMQLAWKERDTNCNCDHNEYCGKCWPLEFREGGKWHKYAAAPSPTIPAGQTRSQKLTAAGFTRRPSLWAREAREALELIAAPMRPDGTWNRDREACRQLAAEALGRSEDTPTPLTERIVYPKIPPRKIQDDDEQPATQEPTP